MWTNGWRKSDWLRRPGEVVMKVEHQDPPREFVVGTTGIRLRDCGRVSLAPDEQITFVTDAGGELDIVRKSWGFYATPSLNGRLPRFGLRPALVRGHENKFFLLLVERGHEDDFEQYVSAQNLRVVQWLDTDAALERLAGLSDGD
jgi:hypothetical protein